MPDAIAVLLLALTASHHVEDIENIESEGGDASQLRVELERIAAVLPPELLPPGLRKKSH